MMIPGSRTSWEIDVACRESSVVISRDEAKN